MTEFLLLLLSLFLAELVVCSVAFLIFYWTGLLRIYGLCPRWLRLRKETE